MAVAGGERSGGTGSDVVLDVAASEGRPGGSLEVYRAVPARGRGPGILVLGEDGRRSALARDAADRLAREGFVALAPECGDAPDASLATGLSALLHDHAVDGRLLGVLGFDRGGVLALALAAAQRRVGAVVDFYGLPDADEAQVLADVEAPVLLLFGDADERADADALAALAKRLPRGSLHVEPGAGAGYMDVRAADRHHAVAAASGWDRALAFLEAAL